MSERSFTFSFNTAITALDENGTLDDKAHLAQVLPVRGRIMQHDGMTGCHVVRPFVNVTRLLVISTKSLF